MLLCIDFEKKNMLLEFLKVNGLNPIQKDTHTEFYFYADFENEYQKCSCVFENVLSSFELVKGNMENKIMFNLFIYNELGMLKFNSNCYLNSFNDSITSYSCINQLFNPF